MNQEFFQGMANSDKMINRLEMMPKEPSGVSIIATSLFVGEKQAESNSVLESRFSWKENDIEIRTGIKIRYKSEKSSTEMGVIAAIKVLESAGLNASDISTLIVCNFIGDYIFPNSATLISKRIGINRALVFDLHANCAATSVAMELANNQLIQTLIKQHCLVISIGNQSPFVDPSDHNTAPYFSDGASALILSNNNTNSGFIDFTNFLSTSALDSVRLRHGGSQYRDPNENTGYYYEHSGLNVWGDTVKNLPTLVKEIAQLSLWDLEDIDLILFHQASLRLIEYVMGKLKLPMSKTLTNVAEVGNLAEASLPSVIHLAWKLNMKKGSKILFVSVGAGFMYSASSYIV